MVRWNCEICNVDVDKSQKARHLKTKKHQNNLNPRETIADILPIDAIEETTKKRKKKRPQNKRINKKDKHSCQVCNETIKKSNIKNHLNSKKHKKRCNENCGFDCSFWAPPTSRDPTHSIYISLDSSRRAE
jgi:hypothetical protein